MEQKTSAEYKTLLSYNKRAAILAELTEEFKGEQKMLKSCIGLISAERRRAKNCKAAISAEDLQDIVWRYDELSDIAGKLKKTANAVVFSRASAELSALREKISVERRQLEMRLSVDIVEDTAACITDKIKSGISKVGGVFDDAVSKLKKAVKGENSE